MNSTPDSTTDSTPESTTDSQLKFQQLLCTWVAMGHWPQRPGQSQSVNLEQLTHQHSLKSGGWPGFEPGSLTFMASALTTKLPTKLVKMCACLLTDGSRHFYQGLHFTCRYNIQLKFQQLLCTWVALATTYMGTGPNGLDKGSL